MPTFQFLGCVVGGEGEDMDEEKEKKKFLYDGELFYKNISCRKFLVLLFPPVYLISLCMESQLSPRRGADGCQKDTLLASVR